MKGEYTYMSKKLDREFKEEFDNELREATYATRKIGIKS